MFRLLSIIALFLTGTLHAQLTLASLDGKSIRKIKTGSLVKINIPMPSAFKECECGINYEGILRGISQDSVWLELKSSNAIIYEPNGLAKNTKTRYKYWGNHKKETPVHLADALKITKIGKAEKTFDRIGYMMIFFSAAHAILTAPLIKDDMRKTSDYVTLGVFSAGLFMAIVPFKKNYYLKQPKNGDHRLWKITSPINTQ